MAVAHRIEPLAAVARYSSTPEAFSFALRDFLDGFYAHPGMQHLEEEPQMLGSALHDGGYADAYLAALSDHLARGLNSPVPRWAQASTRTVPYPVFAFKTSEGRMFLLVESPTAFRQRNIFISADALHRV